MISLGKGPNTGIFFGKHPKIGIFLGENPDFFGGNTQSRYFFVQPPRQGRFGAVVTYGGVVDVVVGSDHAQVERSHVHLILDADALGLLQVTERLLHQLRQVIRQVTVRHAWGTPGRRIIGMWGHEDVG